MFRDVPECSMFQVLSTAPHEYDKCPFLKIYSLDSVFKNLRICGRKHRLRVDGRCNRRKKPLFSKISGYVWAGGANVEKISVFENIRICVNGVLNKGNHERYVVWISVAS